MTRQAGLEPDIVTYNTLIKAAGAAGRLADVKQLFEEVVQDGLRPSPVTYNVLFSAAARSGSRDATWLMATYDAMSAVHGIQPNDLILSAFFAALSHAPCSPAQLERAIAELAPQRSAGGSGDLYTSLLALVTRQGVPDRAVDVWNAAQQDGVRPSAHLFSALFAACSAGSSPALAEVAAQAQAALQQWWRGRCKTMPRGRTAEERWVRVADL